MLLLVTFSFTKILPSKFRIFSLGILYNSMLGLPFWCTYTCNTPLTNSMPQMFSLWTSHKGCYKNELCYILKFTFEFSLTFSAPRAPTVHKTTNDSGKIWTISRDKPRVHLASFIFEFLLFNYTNTHVRFDSIQTNSRKFVTKFISFFIVYDKNYLQIQKDSSGSPKPKVISLITKCVG